jgi:Protein of unknown function (DUF3800)
LCVTDLTRLPNGGVSQGARKSDRPQSIVDGEPPGHIRSRRLYLEVGHLIFARVAHSQREVHVLQNPSGAGVFRMKFAYVDESGDKPQSDVFVMAGVLIDAYKLRKHTVKFDKIISDFLQSIRGRPKN